MSTVPDQLFVQATAFAAAVGSPTVGEDLGAPVPTCPGWSVHDLAGHLGRVHRRVAATITSGSERMLPSDAEVPDGTPPSSRDEVAAWLLEGASSLVEVFGAGPLDREVGGFDGPVPVAWWARRQLHETLVHRLDAELAVGAEPLADVSPELAADGIAEWYDLITAFRSRSRRVRGEGVTVHVHCTDGPGEWLVRRDPEGVTITAEHAKADAAVRGPAVDLLAVVTGRQPLESVEVLGDAEQAQDWVRVSALL